MQKAGYKTVSVAYNEVNHSKVSLKFAISFKPDKSKVLRQHIRSCDRASQ